MYDTTGKNAPIDLEFEAKVTGNDKEFIENLNDQ
jgi:hypothetical protein